MNKSDLVEIIPGGDITDPIGTDSNKIIIHVCNDIPVMGAGVAKALYEKWPVIKRNYLNSPSSKVLGTVQLNTVEYDIVVANCIAQHGIKDKTGVKPIRYQAFCECITKVFSHAENCLKLYNQTASIHIPFNVGCGLAGGKWETIFKMIKNCATAYNIRVYIYDKYNQNT